MLIVGLPWTSTMNHSGSYYGATAVRKVTDLDREQASEAGRASVGVRAAIA